MLANGDCNDDLEDLLAHSNPHLNVTLESVSEGEVQYNIADMIVMREPLQFCDELFNLRENEYRLLEVSLLGSHLFPFLIRALQDGTFLLYSLEFDLYEGDYCLYPYQSYLDFPKSIWIVRHTYTGKMIPAAFELMVISMICYILTIVVYIFIKKLRNILGKCIICSLFSICMVYLIFILDYLNLSSDICSAAGYSSYFFRMAYNLWLSVISYHMCKLFKSVRRSEPRYRFLKYISFVWVTASISTGIIFLIDKIWEKDPKAWNWIPQIGYTTCFIKCTFNVIKFILTAIHIWKVKKEIRRFAQDKKTTTTCFNFDSQSYLQFLRISAMMGVSWILDVSQYFIDANQIWQLFVLIFEYLHDGFGVIVFILLILKRSTIDLIMERFREKL
ncbi:probable G-protein coupled receptor Mth-like 7 [Drosophila rhopaloa]|uniref:Probable G-protein coupled receptor Mth-like 7 n=1 Tax=Drosophila rhopaloa TaxID=1041015 RepID=A0A6P4EBP5_DRORH|nr:probable G-protein coupled receptor Mth-like 7 [Drosophila rhopaloa]